MDGADIAKNFRELSRWRVQESVVKDQILNELGIIREKIRARKFSEAYTRIVTLHYERRAVIEGDGGLNVSLVAALQAFTHSNAVHWGYIEECLQCCTLLENIDSAYSVKAKKKYSTLNDILHKRLKTWSDFDKEVICDNLPILFYADKVFREGRPEAEIIKVLKEKGELCNTYFLIDIIFKASYGKLETQESIGNLDFKEDLVTAGFAPPLANTLSDIVFHAGPILTKRKN